VSVPEDQKDKPSSAGRVKHDAGGRAVWEWAAETGRNALDSTSRLLKRLELPGLSLLDDDKEKKIAEEEVARAEREAGFNPYGEESPLSGSRSSKPAEPARQVPTYGGPAEKDPLANSRRNFNPYNKATPAPKKPVAPRITQPAKPAEKPGLLGRLFGKK
jgi:hypothetical protein